MPLDINNIKYRDLFDKLKVFEIAGEDSSTGWDTAIPQSAWDTLRSMGIEDPQRWFVMDCSGSPWRLRHIGEAVFTILHARSETNKEIFLATIHNNQLLADILQTPMGEAVNSEADAGLIDLNMVIGLITEAYARGRKSTLVNESDLIMESSINPGDHATAPHSVTLRKWGEKQWVTHWHNHQVKGYSEGHYFYNEIDALRDYATRCVQINVKPF